MPELPESSLITRHLFENPWPLAALVLLVGLVIGGIGWRDGYGRRIMTGVGFGVAAVVLLIVGRLVVTAGEHAEAVTVAFVEAVEAGDQVAAMAEFSAEARLHIGAPTNPGVPLAVIDRNVSYLLDRYPIESNRVTRLRSASVNEDEGVVELACYTETEVAVGLTSWHLRVRREAGGWRIIDLTWIELNRSAPPNISMLRR